MALTEIEAICRSCHKTFRAQPKRTFLGFQRLVCPHCSREVMYPLTSGYRTAYWIFVGFMALVILASLAHWSDRFPWSYWSGHDLGAGPGPPAAQGSCDCGNCSGGSSLSFHDSVGFDGAPQLKRDPLARRPCRRGDYPAEI